MRKLTSLCLLILTATPLKALEGAAPQGHQVSRESFQTLENLAAEKEVVRDIEQSNSQRLDEQAFQEIWVRSTEKAEAVKPYLEKPSCKTLRDYFFRTFSLVDCFTLDERGRIVSTLYKTRDFLQDQEPYFVNCYNQGKGRLFINQPEPMFSGKGNAVEIAFPVQNGPKTVGVLVATVLLDE